MTWNDLGWVDMASIVGLALTLTALAIAVYQLRQAAVQSSALVAHEESLSQIAGSLSTRYLGPFPEYLPPVTEMIGRAVDQVVIVNCNPVPGYFSVRGLWIDYEAAIARKIVNGVAVKLTMGSAEQRLRRMQQQFNIPANGWLGWRAQHAREIQSFMNSQRCGVPLDTLTREAFQQQLVDAQTRLTDILFANATHEVEISDTITIQTWVVDNKEAIFSIESTLDEGLSHGLYTSDPQFVRALSVMGAMYETITEK